MENHVPKASMGLVFAGALVYQIFHWIEHVAQVYQHWWLGISLLESHGILFFFDFEWNHFVFNSIYLLGLTIVFWRGGLYKTSTFGGKEAIAVKIFFAGLILQLYHQVEHSVKIYQHISRGCEPCPGILGWYVDGIYLHFFFNTAVLISPLVAFFVLGYFNKLWKSF